MSEPQRYPTRDELDYAARKEAGFPGLGVPSRQSRGEVTALQTQYAVEGNVTEAYVGVTSDRMTYANETEQPLRADGSPDADAEVAREERILSQTPLVSPAGPTPEGEQTEGGGSSQESVYTATSGEGFSSEIAKAPETEKVEVPTADGDTAQIEKGVGAGSSGQTVSEAEAENTEVSAGASSAPDQLSGTGDSSDAPDSPAETSPVPTPTKKATAAKSNATS